MNNWRYDFDCRDCGNKEETGGEIYCKPTRAGIDTIHADDDFVVRCDQYKPMQFMIEEVRTCETGLNRNEGRRD